MMLCLDISLSLVLFYTKYFNFALLILSYLTFDILYIQGGERQKELTLFSRTGLRAFRARDFVAGGEISLSLFC